MSQKNGKIFFIIAGEPSGDLHGAKLMEALKNNYQDCMFIGHGGNQMKNAGLDIIYHTDQLAIMGITEVIKELPFMLNVMGETLGKIRKLKPDRIILIDYPGFNLRLAKNIFGLGIPVTYFILPQLWAWKKRRIKYFHKYIHQSISIFPFEKEWFENRGISVGYFGHPFSEMSNSIDAQNAFFKRQNLDYNDEILTLLPGSRQHEVDKHWPIFVNVIEKILIINPKLKIIVGQAPGVNIPQHKNITVESKDVQSAVASSKAALVSSGTATLECAVLDTPMVVCYKLSFISNFILSLLNKSKYISIVNIILNKKVVNELIQSKMNSNNILESLVPLLSKSEQRKKMLFEFEKVRRLLGFPGAYDRIAKNIIEDL